jgi:hypothetical protein
MRIQILAVVLASFIFIAGCGRAKQVSEGGLTGASAPTTQVSSFPGGSETQTSAAKVPTIEDSIPMAFDTPAGAQQVRASILQNAPDADLVKQSKWIVDLSGEGKNAIKGEIYVPWIGAGVPQGFKGIVLLDAKARVLSFGMFDLRQVQRLIGGLPAVDPVPTEAELAALAQRVAVVAVGRLTSVDDQFGTFSPSAIFKGTNVPLWLPVGQDGSHPSETEPGGRWRLPTDFQESVVLFLNGPAPTGQWWIENLVEPDRVSVEEITKLLGAPSPVN